jgi:hypothetical protein
MNEVDRETERYISARRLARAEMSLEQLTRVYESLRESPHRNGKILTLAANACGQINVLIRLIEEEGMKL